MSWRRLGQATCLMALLFACETAQAQEAEGESLCVDGRVATEASAGRCCWPGQTWSEAESRCEGVPECPEGRVMSGEECEEDLTASAAEPETTTNELPVGEVVPTPSEVAVAAAPVATPGRGLQRTRKNWPLIITGGSLFIAGYLGSALLAIAAYGESACPDRPYFFLIPFAGGVMGAVNASECGSEGAYWLGIPAAAAQLVGVVLLGIGFIEQVVEEDGAVALTDDVAVLAAAPGAEFGATLRVRMP